MSPATNVVSTAVFTRPATRTGFPEEAAEWAPGPTIVKLPEPTTVAFNCYAVACCTFRVKGIGLFCENTAILWTEPPTTVVEIRMRMKRQNRLAAKSRTALAAIVSVVTGFAF